MLAGHFVLAAAVAADLVFRARRQPAAAPA
jgi:hypothetical protein